jgi:hypothetical protein
MHALAAFDDTALQALLETLDTVGRDINAVPDDLPLPRSSAVQGMATERVRAYR